MALSTYSFQNSCKHAQENDATDGCRKQKSHRRQSYVNVVNSTWHFTLSLKGTAEENGATSLGSRVFPCERRLFTAKNETFESPAFIFFENMEILYESSQKPGRDA